MSEEFYFAKTKPIDHDSSVDRGIQECLRIGSGKSFITFAGAGSGSGKTYSLKEANKKKREKRGEQKDREKTRAKHTARTKPSAAPEQNLRTAHEKTA